MRTKDLQASDEKRSYYRLLRYLVSDELEASDIENQARSLELADILNLEHHEPSKIH
jgi:hypothetical protein